MEPIEREIDGQLAGAKARDGLLCSSVRVTCHELSTGLC